MTNNTLASMRILFDTHTHTLVSGHAFSTAEENIAACVRYGLDGLALTDHGPAMPGAAEPIYFRNMHPLPRLSKGIHVLRGVETNILDFAGKLDLPSGILRHLDVCIASYHDICLRPRTPREHTDGWLAVIQNPLVDILGHTGRGDFIFDVDAVMSACRQYGKLIEINNHSLDKDENIGQCNQIAQACKHYGVNIVVSSDAHFSGLVGQVQPALDLLAEMDFPPELIVNQTYGQFKAWLQQRKPWLSDL